MSLIAFTVATLSGALNKCSSNEEIYVAKGVKAKVIMDGYIAGPRVKNDDGTYSVSVFGRLPTRAALAGEGTKTPRLVIDIAGVARGVLFKHTKKDDKDPDYTGNIEVGDQVYPLFGRKVKTEAGEFISLNTLPAETKGQSSNSGSQTSAPAADASFGTAYGDDIPFGPIALRSYL
jgi:hypothetical protein